jgi:hypothetical protein
VSQKTIEVIKDAGRQFDASDSLDQGAGLRAFGARGFSPRERASSQAFASSQGTVFPVARISAHRSSATR